MVMIGLPLVLLNAFVFVENMSPHSQDQEALGGDFYAGIAGIVAQFHQKGQEAFAYDKNRHHIMENMNTGEGYVMAMKRARSLVPGAVSHWGTVCSSWVHLCKVHAL